MSASDHLSPQQFLQPDQFSRLRAGDAGYKSVTIRGIATELYKSEPHFMAALEHSIRTEGVHDPVEFADPDDHYMYGANPRHLVLYEGHHRAAAAYRAGVALPYVKHDDTYPVPTDEAAGRLQHWDTVRASHPEEYQARMNRGER